MNLSVRLSYGQSGNAPTRDYTYFSIYNALITAGSASSIGTPFSYLGQGGIYPSNPELKRFEMGNNNWTKPGI